MATTSRESGPMAQGFTLPGMGVFAPGHNGFAFFYLLLNSSFKDNLALVFSQRCRALSTIGDPLHLQGLNARECSGN